MRVVGCGVTDCVQIIDSETFYLNLTAVIEDSAVPEWESEYTTLEYFNLTELTPLEISSLLLDVTSPTSHLTTDFTKQCFSSDEV